MIKKIAKTIIVWTLYLMVVMIAIPIGIFGGIDWVKEKLAIILELAEEWHI